MHALIKHLSTCKTAAHWARIGIHQHAGINLPLSALRSKYSSGIGEFYDLIPLINWCADLNIDVIQLLPLNDSGSDPSPYNALSSCAIHPIYLSLHKLPYLENPELLKKIEGLDSLNAFEKIDFQTVRISKLHILHSYIEEYGSKILSSSSYETYVNQNPWLQSYALFQVLQHQMGHANFFSWPEEFKYITPQKFKELEEIHSNEISFYIILQYLCFEQLSQVKNHANKNNVFLKGDIPILISPNSADVWFHPEFFNTDLAVGAPPDQYCQEGQNWGFPGFRWDDMKKTDFSWWKQRLEYASSFYDIYRIDHAIGLFRLWCIPPSHPSSDGFFVPGDELLWGPHGKKLLELLLTASPMLPIAEDLGDVPAVVRPILEELGIPGTKVMRWERDWKHNQCFIDSKAYPTISLTCVSTHDSPTLEQWWRDFPEESSIYALQHGLVYTPQISYQIRQSILKASAESSSLFHINLFSEYLALLPEFVAPDPDDERINIPGTLLPSNWSYKFRKSVEEMTSSPELKEEIRKIIIQKKNSP